jgi:3-hydroxymyristoyl/3-hydroxydecanoyl-(acyl carrier protein) dehydratase
LANEVCFLESQWRLLKEVKATNNNHIEALAEVPVDSPWFSGHFPGEPILPGIALVHIVEQAIIEDALTRGILLGVRALKRIRFTQPVRPGDTLSVSATGEENGEDILFSFKVIKEKNVVCSGSISAKKINE